MCFNIIGRPDNIEVLIGPKALCDDCASCELGIKRTARVAGWLHLCERVASSFSDFLGARFQTEPPRGSSVAAGCPFVSSGRASFVHVATAKALAEVAVVLLEMTVSVILLVGNTGRAAGRRRSSEILLMTREDLISDP